MPKLTYLDLIKNKYYDDLDSAWKVPNIKSFCDTKGKDLFNYNIDALKSTTKLLELYYQDWSEDKYSNGLSEFNKSLKQNIRRRAFKYNGEIDKQCIISDVQEHFSRYQNYYDTADDNKSILSYNF